MLPTTTAPHSRLPGPHLSGPRPLWIDCDPGQDDAVALLLALASPEIELIGISTVAGNVPLAHTTRNALRVLELAGAAGRIPVHPGCPRPLLRPLETAEMVHGIDGLAGAALPDPVATPDPTHGVTALLAAATAYPGLALLVLGPATNLAAALAMAPHLVNRLGPVVLMSGAALAGGNSTPVAEFNALTDPHALRIVVEAGLPDLTIVPLDATHGVLTTPAHVEALGALGTGCARAVAGWLGANIGFDMDRYGWPGGPLHDPCTLLPFLAPEAILEALHVPVQVTTEPGPAEGQTIIDRWGMTARPPNARWVTQIDAARVYALLEERLARLP